MKQTETIINLIFDPAKGRVSLSSREATLGKPLGALPEPVRPGYAFAGWYCGEERITSSTVLTEEEDLRLTARWSRVRGDRSKTLLQKQRLAAILLGVIALSLIFSLVYVNAVQDYTLVDTYYESDGTRVTQKYYVRKRAGAYGLYDRRGNAVEQNEDGYYIVLGGNQYEVDPKTGESSLYAAVDYEIEGEESVLYERVLMFPQIKQDNMHSIKVTNEHGSFRFYRGEDGEVYLEGTEETSATYDPELFPSLCVSCGYTLAMKKLDMKGEQIPRLPDGSVDYAAYGLAEGETSAVYTITGDAVTASGKETVTYTVHVGDAIVSGAGYYVRLEGKETVYVLSSRIADTLLQPVETMIQPMAVYPVSMANHLMVRNFILANIGGQVFGADGKPNFSEENIVVAFSYQELEERTGTMYSSSPYLSQLDLMKGYAINGDNVSEMLGRLYEMQYSSCLKLGLTKEALRKYGLDEDVFYISYESRVSDDQLAAEGKIGFVENSIMISKKTDRGTYYVASTAYDMIVEVDQYYLAFLEWDLNRWYDVHPFTEDIAHMQEMKITMGDKTYTFHLDNRLTFAYTVAGDGTPSFVDFTKGTLTRDEKGNYVFYRNGKKVPFELVDFEHGEFRANSQGDAVYMVGNKELKLNTLSNNLMVYCDEFTGGTLAVNLLDYSYTYSYIDDAGNPRTKTYTGLDNFREFYVQLLYFTVGGVIDEKEFEAALGMSVSEYIAQGDGVCQAVIHYRSEDMAKIFNQFTYKDENGQTVKLYEENNTKEIVLRFYRYSEMRSLMTLEVVDKYDDAGNPVFNPANEIGRFFVNALEIENLEKMLDMILSGERIARS
ncbi:MAG: DUF4340 domain-containing protein [Clostridia bacterium]|nr:DUF4340 domain-containing protein [Clostridia bacterium]